jgi:hypothetical protein
MVPHHHTKLTKYAASYNQPGTERGGRRDVGKKIVKILVFEYSISFFSQLLFAKRF